MNNQVISLSEAAIEHIKKQIEEANGKAFRLSVKKTGCNGYMYMPEVVEQGQTSDIKLAYGDLIIYVDPKALDKIKGTKIDFVKKTLGASMLEYHNPNASGLCGCGESFNLEDE